MKPTKRCEWCEAALPPGRGGPRARRFCSDACRKRAARARDIVRPTPGAPDGPVTAAVRAALADIDIDADAVCAARGEVAVVLARLVDAGSVPAAKELGVLLTALDMLESAEHTAFLASVQTPRIGPPRTDP